jgi:integrase
VPGVITVRATYTINGESRRVLMNAVLTATLQRVRMDTLAVTDPVFGSRNGTLYPFGPPLSAQCARQGLQGWCFTAWGICLRSPFVIYGIGLSTVQALLGHKEISMTFRYTHLTTDFPHSGG